VIRRIVLLGVLVAALFGLAVWYGSTPLSFEGGRFPSTGSLAGNYDDLVGERVVVTGRVVATDPVVLHASSGQWTITLRIEGLDRHVEPGDRIQVFGVLEPDNTVRSINSVVAGARTYAWSVSFVAGVWVLVRGIVHWQYDRESGSFQPEEGDRPDA